MGTILLLISIASFGLLPVRLIGIALLVASVVFFVIELKVPGLGIWSIAGIASLVLGGLVLFDPAGGVQVSPFVIVPVAAFMALFFGFVVVESARDAAPAAGAGGRGGRRPGGRRARRRPRSRWGRARRSRRSGGRSPPHPLPPGTKVRVTKLDGLVLTVEPLDLEHAQTGGVAPAQGGNH